jgi:hypothetical protein
MAEEARQRRAFEITGTDPEMTALPITMSPPSETVAPGLGRLAGSEAAAASHLCVQSRRSS